MADLLVDRLTTEPPLNALRFFAFRGSFKVLKSDCGTNFICACMQLKIHIDDPKLKHLLGEGCIWTFNTPHSLHMRLCWEKLIGIAQRILDGMLVQTGPRRLNHFADGRSKGNYVANYPVCLPLLYGDFELLALYKQQ